MKIKIKLTLVLFLLFIVTSAYSSALREPEKRLINAKIDVVWKNILKFFPKKEIKIKKIDKYRYLIIAERKITRQKKFSRNITIKLIPKGEQTVVSFDLGTFIGSAGAGRTRKIVEDFLDEVKKACEQSSFTPSAEQKTVVAREPYEPSIRERVEKGTAEYKIASYNIRHMNEIIDELLVIKMEDRCKAIARNIKAIDPDILAIQEAPKAKKQLEVFVKKFLDDKYLVYFEKSQGRSLALLIRKDINPPCTVKKIERPEYKSKWQDDVDGDGKYEHWLYDFSSPPLELDLKFNSKTLKIVVLHLTSKYGRTLQAKMSARYKLIAEAKRFREIIKSEVGKDMIILGDINDNPGFDPYEKGLGIDGIAELMGEPPNDLRGSLSDIPRKWRFTCIYLSDETNEPDVSWIDRILFTEALNQRPITYKESSGRIHHELLNPLASDHIPISAIFIIK